MDQLNAMQAFRRVVDLGSFSAAASQAGLSHTVLSRQVKQLERQLGTQLLTRTTRRLHLTEPVRSSTATACRSTSRCRR